MARKRQNRGISRRALSGLGKRYSNPSVRNATARGLNLLDKRAPLTVSGGKMSISPNTTNVGYAIPKKFKRGGLVKKTGIAKVHKGERVLTNKQNTKYEKVKKKVFGIKSYGPQK